MKDFRSFNQPTGHSFSKLLWFSGYPNKKIIFFEWSWKKTVVFLCFDGVEGNVKFYVFSLQDLVIINF